MRIQSFATSSAVSQADNSIAGSSVRTSGVRDFLLLCKDGNIAEAVHALYYLPKNYKLMVMGDPSGDSGIDADWLNNSSLRDRIQFENVESTSVKAEQSPYAGADAIISDEVDAERAPSATAPCVVMSATASDGLTARGTNSFTVPSHNPEALASAILRISRKGWQDGVALA